MSYTKFGPDWFSRFEVYWIQTNKQTNRHPPRQTKFIYRLSCHGGTMLICFRETRKKYSSRWRYFPVLFIKYYILTFTLLWEPIIQNTHYFCRIQFKSDLQKCHSDLRKVPIRPSKSAHPTYKMCPFDLQNVPIRPTKSSPIRPTKECPSDLQISISTPLRYIIKA